MYWNRDKLLLVVKTTQETKTDSEKHRTKMLTLKSESDII